MGIERITALLWALALGLTCPACSDDACQEPDPRGAGAEGDDCETTRDCGPALACIGTDFEANALCQPPTELPGGADPGCLDHPDEWPAHEANGVQPIGEDEEGCERLFFVAGCNCVDSPIMEDCLPVMPFYRLETWRRCAGCCWRLVSYWQDDSACDEPDD